MNTIELSGVSVVGAGAFNPAILNPQWLGNKKLLTPDAVTHALESKEPQQLIVSNQFTGFVADWLSLQVTTEKAIFTTVDEGREPDLRDLARAVFDLLPETPIDGIGINADAHFRTEGLSAWHAFGDRFLPKDDFWEPLFAHKQWRERPDGKHRVGMREMKIEVTRKGEDLPGFMRVEVAPSTRVTNGVYVGINAHFQLRKGDDRSNAAHASSVLTGHWDETRAIQRHLVAAIMGEV